MRFRWGVAALAAGAALSLGMTQASARTSDAPPPLTPAQLIALHHVASWDVDFHTTYTGRGDGSATTGPFFQNGRNVTVDAVRSYSFSRSSEAHFTVTTNDSDCNLLDHIGCPVDLTHQASVSFDVEASTQGNFAFSDGCAQDDGTVGPAHIHESDVTSASGSAADSEIDPALLSGRFFVDYRTNPPSVFAGISYNATVHNAERIENDNCFAPPSTWPGPSVNDVSVTAAMLDEVTIGEMKFAFVDGAFETSSTSTTTLDGCVQTGRCGGGAYTSSTETRTFTWNIREHLDNEPRIDSATFQQPDIPTGVMHAVPPTGTFDGNPVQLSLHLANPRPTAQDVQVVVTDTDTGLPAAVSGTQTTTIAAGGTADLTLGWNTNGKAWKADHTPQPAHGFTVKLQSGDAAHTWDTVNRDLIVLPKPVVLVHGWNSSAATWATLQSYLSTHYPYWRNFAVDTMNTGNLLSPLAPSNTVAQNAQALDAYVRSVRSQTEAQHVDLLVHSMGGLISRQYIQDDMPSDASDGLPVVSHLVMLGTPNLGSPCAYLIPWPQPSSFELRPDSVAVFNFHVTDRRGVPFSLLAGIPVPTTCGLAGAGDSVVDALSATQGGAIGDVGFDGTLLHTSMPSSVSSFESFVKPRLAIGGTAAPTPRRVLRKRVVRRTYSSSNVQPQLLATDAVALASGESKSIDVVVGDASAIGGILLAGGDVSAELRAPNGSTAATIAAGAVDPAQPFRSFSDITSPVAGNWSLVLTNTGASALSAAYSVWETGETGMLQVDAADNRDGRALVTAAVLRGSTRTAGETLQATFRAVDGTTTATALVDDGTRGDAVAGDHLFTAVQALPPTDYMLTVRAAGTVARTTFLRLEMRAASAAAGAPGPAPTASPAPVAVTPVAVPGVKPSARRGPPVFAGGVFAPPLRIALHRHSATISGSAAVDEAVTLRLRVQGRGGWSRLLPGTRLAKVSSGKERRDIVARADGPVAYRVLLPRTALTRAGVVVVLTATSDDGQTATVRVRAR